MTAANRLSSPMRKIGQCCPRSTLKENGGTAVTRPTASIVLGRAIRTLLACAILVSWRLAPAEARSRFDGTWNLVFVSQPGACDSSYTFDVTISNGIVSHPNLRKFGGRVKPSGAVWASVTVGDKYASGSGRLTNESGRGVWNGRAGQARCRGYWVAQRG
jgi:hypothetical protein